MRVLITDAELKQALAITQSLGRHGIEVSCVSPRKYAASFYSRYCKEYFLSPSLSSKDEYINMLIDIVKNRKYDLLITCNDISTDFISQERDKFLPFVRTTLPDDKSVQIALNKDRLMRFCEDENLPIPKTFYPKNMAELETIADYLEFPVVVKGNRGTSANQVRYVNSTEALRDAYNELKNKAAKIIVQEHIEGDGYAFYGICDFGQITSFFMYRITRSYPVTGGTPSKAISIYDSNLKEISAKILHRLNWFGMVNLDFIKDKETGEYKLLEINPRFAGTTSLAIACGVDFPVLLFDFIVKGTKQSISRYKINRTFRSLFREEILHAADRPKEIPRMVFEFLNPFVTYGAKMNDFKPSLYLLKNTKWELEEKIANKEKQYAENYR